MWSTGIPSTLAGVVGWQVSWTGGLGRLAGVLDGQI